MATCLVDNIVGARESRQCLLWGNRVARKGALIECCVTRLIVLVRSNVFRVYRAAQLAAQCPVMLPFIFIAPGLIWLPGALRAGANVLFRDKECI